LLNVPAHEAELVRPATRRTPARGAMEHFDANLPDTRKNRTMTMPLSRDRPAEGRPKDGARSHGRAAAGRTPRLDGCPPGWPLREPDARAGDPGPCLGPMPAEAGRSASRGGRAGSRVDR
jgi:hypothetical protein